MVVAFRGETDLTETSLRAHLASLLRLENVGVFLGAGASAGAGGMTMSQLWEHFEADNTTVRTWLEDQNFVESGSGREATRLVGQQLGPPNVETLLDTLAIAISEWQRVGDTKLSDGLEARTAIYQSLIKASKLDDSWWERTGGPSLSEARLSDHRKILQRLSSSRQPGQSPPWVFTTNYDLAVEWSAETIDLNVINGFLGVHSRKFNPQAFDLGFRNVQARGEARFGTYNIYLAKLHGSLTWFEAPDGHFYEVQAREAWKEITGFMSGESSQLYFAVLPSAAKYVQTVGFVIGELFRRFSEFMAKPQTALIVSGYGFGDEHINRLLRSAFQNPTFQLVVYIPHFKDLDNTDELPPAIQRLLALRSPRVTIVGDALFSVFANHLPDPAIYNEDLKALEDRLKTKLEPGHES